MTSENLLQAMGYIDPQLIADAAPDLPKRKRIGVPWKTWAALAACLALLALVIIPLLQSEPALVPIIHEQLDSAAPQAFEGRKIIQPIVKIVDPPPSMVMAVTARLIEVLPDTYTFYDDGNQYPYRLLRMQTDEVVFGEKMCDEFYFLLPAEFMTDFSIYDIFLINSIEQITYERAVLYNRTQGMAERLTLAAFARTNYVFGTDHLGFMAFDAKGNFDIRLWQSSEAWQRLSERATPPQNLKQAKAQATNHSYIPDDLSALSLESIQGEAARILEQITTFESGVFVQETQDSHYRYTFYDSLLNADDKIALTTRRYINGFPTNEQISIFSRETPDAEDFYSWTTARFDDTDLQRLPDLSATCKAISVALAWDDITPPHIQDYEQYDNTVKSVFGWYAKTDDGVIGIVRVTWVYTERLAGYYDDAYYVVEYGADGYEPIERDALIERLGNCEATYISTYAYNQKGWVYEHHGPQS